jgi:hypothetical protein
MERRQRAPRRTGRRTTLTLPAELVEAAERTAAELGTTTNDAIVRLAERGAATQARRERIEELAAERTAAVDAQMAALGDLAGDGRHLSAAEFEAAVMSERTGELP